jgi:hypothetical protein
VLRLKQKNVKAGVAMGRPITCPRSHPRGSVSTTQPQIRGGREEPVERRAAALLLPLEETEIPPPLSL